MLYLILSMFIFTGVILTATAASRHVNSNVVSLITEAVSVIAPLVLVIFTVSKKTVSGHGYGLWMAALSGLLVGFYVLTFNKALTENKVGVVAPVIFGGGLFLSAVLSYFLFNEKLGVLEAIGLVLMLAGLLTIIYARAVTGQ
jgi:uncharacterized membrane protein